MTENSEKIRRKQGLFSLGTTAGRLLAPILGKKGYLLADIIQHWPDIVGESANGAFPDSVSFSSKKEIGAVLHIKTVSGAHATLITARSAEIIDKINKFKGYKAIKSLRVSQGKSFFIPLKQKSSSPSPLPAEKEKELNDLLSETDNGDLKEALLSLGRQVMTKKND